MTIQTRPSTRSQKTTKHMLVWRSIVLEIRRTPKYFDYADHLETIVKKPRGALLPITETGYRSLFIGDEELAAAGGPVLYVQQWLEREAATKKWRALETKRAQLDFLTLLTPAKKKRAHAKAKTGGRS